MHAGLGVLCCDNKLCRGCGDGATDAQARHHGCALELVECTRRPRLTDEVRHGPHRARMQRDRGRRNRRHLQTQRHNASTMDARGRARSLNVHAWQRRIATRLRGGGKRCTQAGAVQPSQGVVKRVAMIRRDRDGMGLAAASGRDDGEQHNADRLSETHKPVSRRPPIRHALSPFLCRHPEADARSPLELLRTSDGDRFGRPTSR